MFEQFAGNLAQLEGSLDTGECIYVLLALMEGYERILSKLGRTHIDLRFCFVTLEGEVRAWLNDNPASNDLPAEVALDEEGW